MGRRRSNRADELADRGIDAPRLFVDHPVAAIRKALDAQVGHELVKAFEDFQAGRLGVMPENPHTFLPRDNQPGHQVL